MDYGWDTSDDEGGMEIDLDAMQEENRELHSRKLEGQSRGSKRMPVTQDYDPSEPTDDYDPSEPTKDSDSEGSGRNQCNLEKDGNTENTCGVKGVVGVSQYDPANPTLSDEEEDSVKPPKVEEKFTSSPKESTKISFSFQKRIKTVISPKESALASPKEEEVNTSPKQGIENTSPDGGNSHGHGVQDFACHSDDHDDDDDDYGNDGRWDSQVAMTQNETSPSSLVYDDDSIRKDSSPENSEMAKENVNGSINEGKSPTRANESPTQTNKSESPSVGALDTDTQNSLLDDLNSVPDVTFDESDFVLEKEPFEKDGDGETKDNTSGPWSRSGQEDIDDPRNKEEPMQPSDDKGSSDSEQRHFNLESVEESGRLRRQEDVDTRNEEALVDLFREESDPDRIEDDLANQPVKKTKKKVGSKKLKKKGKKLKKNQGKKGQTRQQEDGEVEDQRFVEIRRDRQSQDSREEGELEDVGNLVHRKSYEERVPLDVYEQVFDIGNHQEDEQREPGEIVEEQKKKGKKRDKKERKKKKSRREVATIEEGNQDEDSQKFPSFLAGFFVQDEGDEDMDENMENMTQSFENDDDRTFQKGGKTYRKRHSSGAEDSVKSFDQNVDRGVSQEVRHEDSDHRNRRKHDDRRPDSRERRHHEVRESREVRREKDRRQGIPRTKERERERDRDRERSRGDRDRERMRERERERERDRELVRERERERERNRRMEMEERRRRRSRSGSRERRRRSASRERIRRSRSHDNRSARHRRHRSKSRERSVDRDREREQERSKRRHRDRSRERDLEKRVRHTTHSQSHSPRRRSERASSNKENREESHRRRKHARANEESESEDREISHHRHRRERRHRESSSTSSSSSSSTDGSTRHRENVQRRHHHNHNFHGHNSSDEGESSDVILVEPERIVINLDEEEDPPSRIDITHANTEDDSTTVIDGESIPPPPELSGNSRRSALIQINPAEPEVEDISSHSESEGDETPTRDEQTDRVQRRQQPAKSIPESDYDPAHPTEEAEEQETRPSIPVATPTSAPSPVEPGPVPPDHPPPEEVRPSPPPGPALIETNLVAPPLQPPPLPEGPRPQLSLMSSPFQQQQPPPQQTPQQQQGLLPFPSGPGQAQRFPPWQLANGPVGTIMPQNSGPPPGFPPNQRGLLPTSDARSLFSVDSSRMPPPFAQLPHLPRPPPPRESLPQQMGMRPPIPISAMAPLAQLTSLLPALERSKMVAHRNELSMSQPSQMFKHPLAMPSLQTSLMGKGPLMSSSAPNTSSGPLRPSRGRAGGDLSESTEVIDMDMSPGDDDCELELPSPNSSDSDRDERRRRGRKSDSRTSRTVNDNSRSGPGTDKGVIQPAVYLKALSKVIEKLTPKGQPQTSAASGAASAQDKPRVQLAKKKRMEINDDDVPASAVDLTNKEKYLKKLHLQERVIDEVKLAIKPFYSSKKISKEQYKLILRKAVPKVCHSKSGNINPQKIQQLVEAYVNKIRKGNQGGGGLGKKKKLHQAKDTQPPTKDSAPTPVRQNGERAKKQPTR